MKKHIGTIAAWVICIGIAVGISVWQCSFLGTDLNGLTGGISNGCFAAAVIYLGMAILTAVSGQGAFRGSRYFLYTLKMKFARKDDTDRVLISYYDFVKGLEEKQHLSVRPLLLPGLAALLIAVVCCVINVTI